MAIQPELVGRMVTAAMDGFQQGGVAPVVKHFPGHGDTERTAIWGWPLYRMAGIAWTRWNWRRFVKPSRQACR
jgi:beta-N-acetylhexosaminidase